MRADGAPPQTQVWRSLRCCNLAARPPSVASSDVAAAAPPSAELLLCRCCLRQVLHGCWATCLSCDCTAARRYSFAHPAQCSCSDRRWYVYRAHGRAGHALTAYAGCRRSSMPAARRPVTQPSKLLAGAFQGRQPAAHVSSVVYVASALLVERMRRLHRCSSVALFCSVSMTTDNARDATANAAPYASALHESKPEHTHRHAQAIDAADRVLAGHVCNADVRRQFSNHCSLVIVSEHHACLAGAL